MKIYFQFSYYKSTMYVPSQWEPTLQCNIVSHWLGTYIKWSVNTAWQESISPLKCTSDLSVFPAAFHAALLPFRAAISSWCPPLLRWLLAVAGLCLHEDTPPLASAVSQPALGELTCSGYAASRRTIPGLGLTAWRYSIVDLYSSRFHLWYFV